MYLWITLFKDFDGVGGWGWEGVGGGVGVGSKCVQAITGLVACFSLDMFFLSGLFCCCLFVCFCCCCFTM